MSPVNEMAAPQGQGYSMDRITSSDQLESGSKVGYWMIMKGHYNATSGLDGRINAPRHVELSQSQGASSTMTSSMYCGIEQSGYSYVDLPQTPQNGLQQSLVENSEGTSETLRSSSIFGSNKQLNCSSTVNHIPSFNLLGYPCANTTPSCDTSGVQFQSPFKNQEPYECSKPYDTTNNRNNPSTVPSSSINDPSCSTWLGANTFRFNPTPNTSTPDLQSPVENQQTAVNQLSQCLKPTSNVPPPFGPNEFKLTISLSPWDVSMQNVEWMYIDKTGVKLALNLNTSFLLEHLYNTYSRLNSTITMRLPETGREYQICPKDMEMIDVYTGEKIALFRKINMPDLVQPLQ